MSIGLIFSTLPIGVGVFNMTHFKMSKYSGNVSMYKFSVHDYIMYTYVYNTTYEYAGQVTIKTCHLATPIVIAARWSVEEYIN